MNNNASCAFCSASVEKLNLQAQAIDKRLFLFAYYKPKAFPATESTLVQFYVAVINLYSLFWDCGPFVMNSLLNKNSLNCLFEWAQRGQLTPKSEEIYSAITRLQYVLRGFRNSACHNNANEFYHNQQNKDYIDKFIFELKLNPATLFSVDYQKCLDELCRQAIEVVDGIEHCLNWLKTVEQSQKDRIINSWLEYICRWYFTKKSNFDGYLEELKDLHRAKFHKQKMPLYDWLQGNFSGADSSRWLEKQRLLNLLNDVNNCPEPALPIPIFQALTKDVYKFAMTDNII